MKIVRITPAEYHVEIDLKYATNDNFTGQPVYLENAACYLHSAAAQCLKTAIALAAPLDLRFRIYDAFRPGEAQWILWEHTPDPDFLADPAKGSPHSRGVAVDLTLIDRHGVALDMGTGFDAFTPLSHHGRTDISLQAQKNRLLLMGIMTTAGWDFYRNEWWHYQLFQSKTYPVLTDRESETRIMPPA